MKSKLHNDEALLREKLRGHEFPADEESWEQMERLLDGIPAPSAPSANLPTSTSASFSTSWIFSWITALSLGGLMVILTVSGSASVKKPFRPESGQELLEGSSSNVQASQIDALKARTKTTPSQSAYQPGKADKPSPSSKTPASDLPRNSKSQVPVLKGSDSPSFSFHSNSPIANAGKEAASNATGNGGTVLQVASVEQAGKDPIHSSKPTSLETTPVESSTQAENSPGLSILPLPFIGYQTLSLPAKTFPPVSKTITPTKMIRERKSRLGVALGGQSAVVNQREKVIDLLPAFGITMTHQINSKWALQADVMYKKVKGYNWSVSVSDQGFTALGNYNSWSVSRTTQEITFIEMPILLKRQLMRGKQSVFAGFRPAWVHAVPGEGSSSYYNYGNGNSPSAISQRYDEFSSIQNGIRRFDLALTLGCEARIWKNLWIDLRYSQGLLDLTYDNFFSNSFTDVTSDAQISLRYYFWSF